MSSVCPRAQAWAYDPAKKALSDSQKGGACLTAGDGTHPGFAKTGCAALAVAAAGGQIKEAAAGGKCLAAVPATGGGGGGGGAGTAGVADQYMMGDDYMAAPVLNLGQRARAVYFPKGADWTHHYTSKVRHPLTLLRRPRETALSNFLSPSLSRCQCVRVCVCVCVCVCVLPSF